MLPQILEDGPRKMDWWRPVLYVPTSVPPHNPPALPPQRRHLVELPDPPYPAVGRARPPVLLFVPERQNPYPRELKQLFVDASEE